MTSVLEKLDVFRMSYPLLGLGFLGAMVAIPYFFQKSEENQKLLMSTQSEEAQRRRAELWAKASPHARMMAETNIQRLGTLLNDVKNGDIDKHYHAAMRGKIYGGMNPRSSKYAGTMPGDNTLKK